MAEVDKPLQEKTEKQEKRIAEEEGRRRRVHKEKRHTGGLFNYNLKMSYSDIFFILVYVLEMQQSSR